MTRSSPAGLSARSRRGVPRRRAQRADPRRRRAKAGDHRGAFARAAAVDATLAQRVPELARIVGLRNRVIHGYDSVDDEIVWDVVRTKVPDLEARVTALLAEGDAAPGGPRR
jgi:Protein of unknown function DUF86